MKKLLVLIGVLCITKSVYAQQDNLKINNSKTIGFEYSKIEDYIDSLFQHTNSLNKCLSGVLFVRFYFNEEGHPTNIQTNEGAPGFLDTVFRQALLRNRIPRKNIMVNKLYILPVIYDLYYGCPMDTSTKKAGPFEKLLTKIPSGTLPNKDGYIYSFMNMINFRKTKDIAPAKLYPPIECVLLNPFKLNSPVLETGYNK